MAKDTFQNDLFVSLNDLWKILVCLAMIKLTLSRNKSLQKKKRRNLRWPKADFILFNLPRRKRNRICHQFFLFYERKKVYCKRQKMFIKNRIWMFSTIKAIMLSDTRPEFLCLKHDGQCYYYVTIVNIESISSILFGRILVRLLRNIAFLSFKNVSVIPL